MSFRRPLKMNVPLVSVVVVVVEPLPLIVMVTPGNPKPPEDAVPNMLTVATVVGVKLMAVIFAPVMFV